MVRRVVVSAVLLVLAIPIFAANLGSQPMNIDGLTIDLLTVERKGNVMTVKWAVRNGSDKSQTVEFVLSGRPTTYAVDEENGTKYYVLADKEGNSLASEHSYIGSAGSGIYESIDAGQTKRFWMKLPAPPPAVKSITIYFTDTDPFESVAITDKQ